MEVSYEKHYNVKIHHHEIYVDNMRYKHSLRPNEFDNINLNKIGHINNFKHIDSSDDIYLFLFDKDKACGGNYFHFCFHFMQKLHGYLQIKNYVPNMKIIIRLDLNNFQKELILKFIDEKDIIYLDVVNNWYNIKSCFIGKFINLNEIPHFLFNIYQDISEKIYDYSNFIAQNKIFIERKAINNAGKERVIINNIDFRSYLTKSNFLTLNFDNKNIEDKIKLLMNSRPKLIVIETGSGLVNLLFIPKIILKKIKIILLNPNAWNIKNSRIYKIFEILDITPIVINCESIIKNNNTDIINNPYIINLKLLQYNTNKVDNII